MLRILPLQPTGFAAAVKATGTIKCAVERDQARSRSPPDLRPTSARPPPDLRHLCDQMYSPIAVSDIGEALANVAADRGARFANQVLALAGEPHSFAEVAQRLQPNRDPTLIRRRQPQPQSEP